MGSKIELVRQCRAGAQDGISTHICHVPPELSFGLIARASPPSRGLGTGAMPRRSDATEIVVEDETPGECLGRYRCAARRYLAAFALRLDLRRSGWKQRRDKIVRGRIAR